MIYYCFQTKFKAKSPFTKGVFITLSNPSNKTLEYFYDKSSRIILFTVEELYLLCENKVLLIDILNGKFRYLEETGYIYRHIMNLL